MEEEPAYYLSELGSPRDQLISIMHWLRGGNWPWVPASKIKDEKAQIFELITGNTFGRPCYPRCFGCYYDLAMQFSSDVLYVTHFESLVGLEGGGIKRASNQRNWQYHSLPGCLLIS